MDVHCHHFIFQVKSVKPASYFTVRLKVSTCSTIIDAIYTQHFTFSFPLSYAKSVFQGWKAQQSHLLVSKQLNTHLEI